MISLIIRRPWPSPRQGRRLGPPEVWNLLCLCCSRVAACPLPAHPSRQLPPSSWPSAFQHCQPALCLHIALSCYGIRACRLPGFKPLKPLTPSNSFAAASTKPGRQPLLLQGCCSFMAVSVPALQPALCLHSFLLLGHSSLPFARLQTPKTLRGSFHQAWPSAFAAPGLLLFPGRQRSSIAACPLPAKLSLVRACEPAVCQASNP